MQRGMTGGILGAELAFIYGGWTTGGILEVELLDI